MHNFTHSYLKAVKPCYFMVQGKYVFWIYPVSVFPVRFLKYLIFFIIMCCNIYVNCTFNGIKNHQGLHVWKRDREKESKTSFDSYWPTIIQREKPMIVCSCCGYSHYLAKVALDLILSFFISEMFHSDLYNSCRSFCIFLHFWISNHRDPFYL